MKILPSAEKRERRSSATPYQRPKGFVDKVKDWLTPSKWVTWRGDAPVPRSVERDSHVISDGSSSSAGSVPPTCSAPSFFPTSDVREQRGRTAVEQSSSDPVPPSDLFHDSLLAGRNGLISGSSRVPPDSSTLQRLSQQMEVGGSGTLPPVGVAAAVSNRETSGPVTSTPQVSPEMVVREKDVNEIHTIASRQKDKPSFSTSTFHTPSHRHSKTELSLAQSPFKSPFYSGRTSFGGASSFRRKRGRAESSPPTAVKVSQLRVQAEPAALSSIAGSSASQTARRILSTLHSMSSPLADARRLPLRVAPMAKRARRGPSPSVSSPPPVSSLTAPSPAPMSAVVQPVVVPAKRAYSGPSSSSPPPVSSLTTPSLALSLSSHQPVVVPGEQRPSPGIRTVSFTLPSDQTTPTRSEPGWKSKMSVSGSVSPHEASPKAFIAGTSRVGGHGGKMRTARHSSHYSSRKDSSSDNTPTNPLRIPPAITFTLSSSQPLPVLSFGAPPIPSSPVIRSPTYSPPAFSFAKPKPIVGSQMTLLSGGKPDQSSSVPIFQPPAVAKKASKAGPLSSDLKLTPPRRREMPSPSKISPFPTPEKPASSEPPSLKSVSVVEALMRPEYQIENIRNEAQQSGRGSVEVVDLTDSDSPKKNEEGVQVLAGTGKPLSLPAQPAGTWSCDECWTRNKPKATACAACGAPRNGSSGKPLSWSCDECWTSNKPEATACAACGVPRTGSSTSSLGSGSISDVSRSKSSSGSGIGLGSGSSADGMDLVPKNGAAMKIAPSQGSSAGSRPGLFSTSVSGMGLQPGPVSKGGLIPGEGGIKLNVNLSSLLGPTAFPSQSRTSASSFPPKPVMSSSLSGNTMPFSLPKTTTSSSLQGATLSSSLLGTTTASSLLGATVSSSLSGTTTSSSLLETTLSSSRSETSLPSSLSGGSSFSSQPSSTVSLSLFKASMPSSLSGTSLSSSLSGTAVSSSLSRTTVSSSLSGTTMSSSLSGTAMSSSLSGTASSSSLSETAVPPSSSEATLSSSTSSASGGFKLGAVKLADNSEGKHSTSSSSSSKVVSSASSPETWSHSSSNGNKSGPVSHATEKSTSVPTPSSVAISTISSQLLATGQLPMLQSNPADSWECPDCMIVNKSSATSCVACTAKKPGSAQPTSTVAASEPILAKPTLGVNFGSTGFGVGLGPTPGLGSGLAKPAAIGAGKPGTELSLGQPGLTLGQAGGLKLPPLTSRMFGGVQSTSLAMQPPPLMFTASASNPQTSLIGSSSGGLPAATGSGGSNNVVMPTLRKLHPPGPSAVPSTTGGILPGALQSTSMIQGGPLQFGLPAASLGPSGVSSQGTSPFTFAMTKTSGNSSSLQKLSFVAPTFSSSAATSTSAAVSMATAPAASFNFSGVAGPKPPPTSLASQQPTGLFKPPAASLEGKGTPSLGFPSAGIPLGGGVSGGLPFGANAASQPISLEGPKLLFGGAMPAASGVGSSLQQQTPLALQAGAVPSQNKPDLSLPSGSSLLFGAGGAGFTAPQQQSGQLGAGVQPPKPTLTSGPSTGFNFDQFSSAQPQFQFVQGSTVPPTTNSTIFQFGIGGSTTTAGSSLPSINQQVPPGVSTGIGGRPIKRAVRRRR